MKECSLKDDRDGNYFLSGGEDRVLKMWGYDEGLSVCYGIGHAGAINRVD